MIMARSIPRFTVPIRSPTGQYRLPYRRPPSPFRSTGYRYRDMGAYEDVLSPAESKPEAIFDALWATAKEIWPDDTAKAETWVKRQVLRYGIAEAKGTAIQISQSPWTWVIGGVILGWIVSRR